MSYERFIYDKLLSLTRKTKNRYMKKEIARDELEHLGGIDLDGWSLKDRKEAYRQEVLPYWQKFGIAPERFWFELAGSRDHRIDPRFLPADLYFVELLPYLNNGLQRPGLVNKGYLEYLFSDVNQPRTVFLKTEGVLCDGKRRLISEKEAIGLCREGSGALLLKPSVDSCSGSGIVAFTPSEYTDEDLCRLFREAGVSFIVQERIRQHPVLGRLNTASVSTIRVFSLLLEDKVYIEGAALRVSAPESQFVSTVDEGFYVEILEGGKLHPKAHSNDGRWIENGSGLYDSSFAIPFIDRVYDEVRRIHPRMGHFKCLGWDFTIDEYGDPVMIECNVFPGLGSPQLARCKPAFNERTDWILEDFFIRRTWEKNHSQSMLIQ